MCARFSTPWISLCNVPEDFWREPMHRNAAAGFARRIRTLKKSPNSWGGTDPRRRSQFSPRLYTALDLGTSWSSAGSPCDRSTQSHQSVRFGGCVLREVPLPNGRGLQCSKLFGLLGAHGACLFSSAYFFGPG